MPITNANPLFAPGLGGPSENYRIPSMVVTKHSTIVACADARYFTGSDNPNKIDKVIRRSTDNGETWGDFIIAVHEKGESKNTSSASIDPVMVYVEKLDRIYMLFCRTPAGVGILNCKRTKGEDKDGNLIVKHGKQKLVAKDGCLYKLNGEKTQYTIDDEQNIFDGEKLICNAFIGDEFKCENTSFLMECHSDDDGLTWSKPRSLNKMVKERYMGFIGPGPGVGIVVKHGKYAGRIVVPIYYGTQQLLALSCACIYSDDDGLTWKRGISPNSTRKVGIFKLTDRAIVEPLMLTESQLIEQEDGTLKYFMRNHSPKRRVAVAYSHDGGHTWENYHHDENLPQPICQLSVLKLEGLDKPYVVFLNPSSTKERANGVVRLSEDDGETFPYSRTVKEGPFVYSVLAQLPDGSIGALYEPNLECKQIDFVKFTIDWIKGKE